MNNTIKQLEIYIAEHRQEITRYEKEIAKVEEDNNYDHPYWQGLTDELDWEKKTLARRSEELNDLKG